MILILWLLYLWKRIIAKNWIAFFPQHTLPSFALPAEKDGTVYPLPSVVYRMFDYTDVPEVSLLMQSWLLQRVVAYSSLCILPLERVIVHRHYWGNNTPYKVNFSMICYKCYYWIFDWGFFCNWGPDYWYQWFLNVIKDAMLE